MRVYLEPGSFSEEDETDVYSHTATCNVPVSTESHRYIYIRPKDIFIWLHRGPSPKTMASFSLVSLFRVIGCKKCKPCCILVLHYKWNLKDMASRLPRYCSLLAVLEKRAEDNTDCQNLRSIYRHKICVFSCFKVRGQRLQ